MTAVRETETGALATDAALDQLDDNDLLRLTREGNNEAYAALYDRYVYGARRLARHLGQREETEDVVSDAFAQVFGLLQRGKGPDRAFRAYLFTTIRHESGRRAKANKRVMPTDDETQIDSAVPFGGGQLDGFERTAVRAAYESLPDRWRTVLWHLDVEGRKPNEIAEVMGLKPNSVSALVYRARAGLREAYLQQHVNADEPAAKTCESVRGLLAAVVRRTATVRDQEKVHAHLETCDECLAVHLELQEVNRQVGELTVPATVAATVGGGAVLAGGAVVTHLFAGAKGLLVAAAAPAAAAAVTTVAVLSGPAQAPAAAAEPRSTQAVVDAPVVTSQRSAEPRSLPAATSPSTLPTKAPTRAAKSTVPAPAPSTPAPVAAPQVPVAVSVGGGSVDVTAGPVKISTSVVTDVTKQVAPRTTAVVTGLLGGS